jgi:hypothetical protein
MPSHGLNTLHFDGTTDAQKHFLGFQISTPGQNLSLSISEVDTLKQVFSFSDKLHQLVSNSSRRKILNLVNSSRKFLLDTSHICFLLSVTYTMY